MSRERDLKRLKKSLYQTQDLLNELISETGAELEQKWDETRTDTGKRLEKAGKRFEKNYEQARTSLNNIIKETSEDVGKKYTKSKKEAEKAYAETRKDAEKTYNKTRKEAGKTYDKTRKEATVAFNKTKSDVQDNYENLRVEAIKRLAELKDNATERAAELKLRTADLLQGVATGVLSARNMLSPEKRLAVRNEKEKHHLGKMGYAKRFVALAIVIISKKDQLLNLGQQIYHKLQDRNAQEAFKNEALEQLDTMRRLVKAIANGHYKEFPYVSLVKIVAGILYFVSVVDLIPDFIPILGLTDDLAVLAWIYTSVKDDLQQFVDWEAANEYRRGKMESQRSGANSASAADRDASSNAAANRGTAAGTNATAGAGTTTARVNPGGGTTSSGVGAATGSTGSTGTTSGGSTSTGSTTGGSTTNTTGGSSSGSDKNSGGNSGSSPKGSGGSSSGGGSNSNKR